MSTARKDRPRSNWLSCPTCDCWSRRPEAEERAVAGAVLCLGCRTTLYRLPVGAAIALDRDHQAVAAGGDR
jgi:hypothetical protein